MSGSSWFDRIRLGLAAFREAYLTSAGIDTDNWNEINARQLRYQILWAQYEQTSYRDVHSWANAYRTEYALYKYIRPVYNPAYRDGEFWKAHLFGGLLDPDAGPIGAIPIATENETLRPAIAELWKWSRWEVNKDILSVRGSILGDSIIRVVDDVQRERVYLELLYPGLLTEIEKDPFGNVKGYGIQEIVANPNGSGTVRYNEVVSRDGDNVVYETFLNGEPFAWPTNVNRSGEAVATWSEPYGFVPLVTIQHDDVGLEWGWSALHPIRAKVIEADGLASIMSDYIRKAFDPVWLMKAMSQTDLTMTGADATIDSPAPGREELKAIWSVPENASAEAMVAKLDLANALVHLNSILEEIERDVIELSSDIHTASGDASGRALRTARQPVTSKVVQHRAGYDKAMVSAQQMAVAIGGWRGYDEYNAFNLDSFAKGDLKHSIMPRPVFQEDPLDVIEIDNAFWTAAGVAVTKAGATLESYLREAGWDAAHIAEFMSVDGGLEDAEAD